MKVTYEGYAIIPRYEIKADSIPVQAIYSTLEAAQKGLQYYLKDGVVRKVTVLVEEIDTNN